MGEDPVAVDIALGTVAGATDGAAAGVAEPVPAFRLLAAALRATTGDGLLDAGLAWDPPLKKPEIVGVDVLGAVGAADCGEWPWTMAEVLGSAPLPEPPRGGKAAPPPARLTGFHGVEMPFDEDESEADASAAARVLSDWVLVAVGTAGAWAATSPPPPPAGLFASADANGGKSLGARPDQLLYRVIHKISNQDLLSIGHF